MIHERKARLQDVVDLKDSLREIDVKECKAFGYTPEKALCLSYVRSDIAWTVVDTKGKPLAMLGVTPTDHNPKVGVPWLLSSNTIDKYAIKFLRKNEEIFNTMFKYYPILTNLVAEDNSVAIKWLRWCGFDFDLNPIDVGGMKFIRFIRSEL